MGLDCQQALGTYTLRWEVLSTGHGKFSVKSEVGVACPNEGGGGEPGLTVFRVLCFRIPSLAPPKFCCHPFRVTAALGTGFNYWETWAQCMNPETPGPQKTLVCSRLTGLIEHLVHKHDHTLVIFNCKLRMIIQWFFFFLKKKRLLKPLL